MWAFILCLLRCIPFIGRFFKEDWESLHPVSKQPLKTSRKVAIVGYGLGGATTAYFLREKLGQSVELHVFGDGKVGGRTGVTQFSGDNFEAGASIIHRKNRYLNGLSSKFGLKKASLPDEYLAIFNGIQFLFRSSAIPMVTTLKLIWNYGFALQKIQSHMKRLWAGLYNLYEMQGKGQSFTDPVAMVKAMGGDSLYQLTQVTAEDYFKNELGWGDRIVTEIVGGASRHIYGGSIDEVSAMAGTVAIAGCENDQLYAIAGGNYQIPLKALESSGAEVHNVHVTKVVRIVTAEKSSPSFVLHYIEGEAVGQTEMWDAVVLACPLENSGIQFEGFDAVPSVKQKFRNTVANFVHGKLNPRFFGAEERDSTFPQQILTIKMQKPAVEFTSIELLPPAGMTKQQRSYYVKAVTKDSAQVYRMFTTEPLTDDQLNLIFSEYTDYKAIKWPVAFPRYTSPQDYSSFVLNKGLFYVNCAEHVFSAMEMSCIGGKNVSLLATDYLHKLDN